MQNIVMGQTINLEDTSLDIFVKPKTYIVWKLLNYN